MDKLSKSAHQWVRENRKKLLQEFCSDTIYKSQGQPSTIFMAGTPGAGKTEFSKKLIEEFPVKMVRIDADEIRELMRDIGYNGANAKVFQTAATKGVNQLYDQALKKGYSAVVDGTFSYGSWRENIDRSLGRGRLVEIYYLYQEPEIAWDFAKRREANEGRAVPAETFIDAYIKSIRNVNEAKRIFGNKVKVNYAENDYRKNVKKIELDIDNVERYLPKIYNEDELKGLLHERSSS